MNAIADTAPDVELCSSQVGVQLQEVSRPLGSCSKSAGGEPQSMAKVGSLPNT